MRRDALVVSLTPTWRTALRAELFALTLSGRRTELFARLVALVVLGWFFVDAFRDGSCPGVTTPPHPSVLVPLAILLGWFVKPLVGAARVARTGSAARARELTIHHEGFFAEGGGVSLAAAWSVVRSVRPTAKGVVIVMDALCIYVPDVATPTVQAIAGVFRQASSPAESTPPVVTDRGPYRSLLEQPVDEEARPEEWVPAPGYPHDALSFTSRVDAALALFAVRWRRLLLPLALLGVATPFAWLAMKESVVRSGFLGVASFFALVALSALATSLARTLAFLGDRFVRERREGVLYAVGGAGLYVRTHHFERRESWDDVVAAKCSRRRIILTSKSGIHVVPTSAFRKPEDRAAFERVVKRELAARRPVAA